MKINPKILLTPIIIILFINYCYSENKILEFDSNQEISKITLNVSNSVLFFYDQNGNRVLQIVRENDVFANEVWVSNSYCDGCPNDGHIWGFDAFKNTEKAIAALSPGGIMHVDDDHHSFPIPFAMSIFGGIFLPNSPIITVYSPDPVTYENATFVDTDGTYDFFEINGAGNVYCTNCTFISNGNVLTNCYEIMNKVSGIGSGRLILDSPVCDPPALISPFNWSWNVNVLPVLEWEDVNGAESYTLQIARDMFFGDVIYQNNEVPGSIYQLPEDVLEYYTGYYWRVAVNLRGETFEFSAPWRFNTEKLECVMISPEPWAIDVPRTPTFEWSEEPNVDSYHLEISTYSDFSSLLLDEPALTETTYDYPGVLNFGNNYYWRVVPKANGVEGYKREYSRFRTEDIGTPELIAPSDREADIPIRPSFSWGTVSNADAYILEVSDGYGYWTPVVHEIKFETEHSVADLDLLYDENYFWRVRAVIGTEKGPWAPIRMFWTEKIGVPELYSPSDFSYNVALTPTLEWEDLFGAASYNLQMSQRSNFRTLEFEVADITGNTYEIPAGDLAYNTRYYWRVSQNKANQTGDWSDDYSFRTQRAKGLDLYTLESGNMLSPPFPNPFSSTTSFSLNLSEEQYIIIELNDMLGKKVATIYSGILPKGLHDFTIDSHGLTDGVYLYRIQGTDFMETSKVVLKR